MKLLISRIGITVLISLCCFLPGCLKFPIGDPNTAKMDPAFAGYWLGENESGGTLYMVVPFDDHAYVVQQVNYKQTISGIGDQKSQVAKAWLTDVKGTMILTAEPVVQRMPGHQQDKFYQVMRIKITGDKAQTNELEDEFEPLKTAASSADVAAVVEKEVNNPQLYKDEIDFRKLDPSKEQEKKLIDAIMGN